MVKYRDEHWYRIVAPHFVAAITVTDGFVDEAAPILGWSIGWHRDRFFEYCKARNWNVEMLGGL
jgi:hypothetical protein